MAALVALAPPFLSNDMYRYVWDGWVQLAGINPYRYIPADSHLAMLRDGVIYPNINRASYAPTIYPPAAELVFAGSALLDRLLHLPPVLGLKLAMLGCEALGVWAMLRLLRVAGLPRQRILIYLWNPLPLWEFAGSGHADAIAVACIALALLAAATCRPVPAALALALAVLVKFLPVILLPALWRRWDWRFALAFTAAIVMLYAPYLGVGRRVFGFLGGYGAQEGLDSGQGIFIVAALGQVLTLPAVAGRVFMLLLALLLAVVGAGMVFGPALPEAAGPRAVAMCRRAMLLGGIAMAGIAPHYPWYYAWLLVPACIVPCLSILYLATASTLLYLNPVHSQLFWPALLFVPFAVLAARDLWTARQNPSGLPTLEGEAIS